jgi:TonB family protein
MLAAYILNSLWQTPLLFAAAWIAARAVRAAGPAAEHRVWVGALLLESALPGISILPWQRVHIVWPWHAQAASAGGGQVSVQMGGGTGFAALLLPPPVMTGLAVAYVLLTAFFVARLLWQCWRLRVLMQRTGPLTSSVEAALLSAQWSHRFGIERRISLVSSDEIFAPVTMGVWRKCVVLPTGMVNRLPHSDIETAIAHEFAHIRRNDFLWNLVYEILSLPVSYHPCLWFTRQRIMETREMVCDEMAAEISGNQEYAQSLLRLAALLLQGRPVRVPHAIGIFDANTLERRLMKLTEKKKPLSRLRVGISVAACFVLAAAAATSAVALRVAVDSQAADKASSNKGIPTSVPADVMAGNIISKVNPKYPPDAKKAGIQGKVVLDAVVSKTGVVENLKVVSGPNELQQSSLDAVRQWRYKPFVWKGNPIEVQTTINVIYSLQK